VSNRACALLVGDNITNVEAIDIDFGKRDVIFRIRVSGTLVYVG
jgi:hypothetical protein